LVDVRYNQQYRLDSSANETQNQPPRKERLVPVITKPHDFAKSFEWFDLVDDSHIDENFAGCATFVSDNNRVYAFGKRNDGRRTSGINSWKILTLEVVRRQEWEQASEISRCYDLGSAFSSSTVPIGYRRDFVASPSREIGLEESHGWVRHWASHAQVGKLRSNSADKNRFRSQNRETGDRALSGSNCRTSRDVG